MLPQKQYGVFLTLSEIGLLEEELEAKSNWLFNEAHQKQDPEAMEVHQDIERILKKLREVTGETDLVKLK